MRNDTQSKTTHLGERLYTPFVRATGVAEEVFGQKFGNVTFL